MTVTTSSNKTQPLGNGVTTSFPYAFRIFAASDLVVVSTVIATGVDTPLVLGTDYTVTGAGSYNGGNVVFGTAPVTGVRITIRRVLPITQQTDLRNNGAYFAETHEDVFDRQTMVDQQIQEQFSRELLQPISDTVQIGELPSAAARANKLFSYDADGNPTAVFPSSQSATELQAMLADSADVTKGAALVGFHRAGAGAAPRTALDKMRDSVSVRDSSTTAVDGTTSNQADIVAAVADALARGVALFWPAGTYVSTATIPNFHDVAHFGPGIVKRGTDLFYMSPTGTQTNTIYTATTGNDSNDGLSASQPIKTIQGALDLLKSPYIPRAIADGVWRFKFAAGTYTDGGSFTGNLTAKNYVEFVGEVDGSNVPTTIIDGTTSLETAGLYFDGAPSQIKVKDISAINFRANSVASGVVFANKGIAKAYTFNVHTYNNLWAGINTDSIGQWLMTGGVHDANTNYNLRARGGIAVSIGVNSASNRITLKNNVTAVQIRDCCSGHFDYVDVINNPTTPTGTGMWVTNVSRIVLNECTLTNCNLGILAGNGATLSFDSATTFTNVSTQYRTEGNASKDDDAADGHIGTGLQYDKFFNRYALGQLIWSTSVQPFSSSSYAFCTNRTGTADFSFLVPNSTTPRFLFGNPASTSYMRMDADIVNDRWTWVTNGTAVLRAIATEVNSGRDNASSLGSGAARWTVVYAASATINTSDEREKQQIKPIDEAALRAWAKVEYCQFKFNDAVEAKGDGAARWHFGVIAQRVKAAFESEGLDAFAYGLLCYDEWPEQQEKKDNDGNVTQAYRPAGNRYGIRYEEALALECAYLRSKLPA